MSIEMPLASCPTIARPSARDRLTVGIVTNAPLTRVQHARGRTRSIRGVVVDDDPGRAGVGGIPRLDGEAADPRSISTILPATAPALEKGEQPSVVVPGVVPASTPSTAAIAGAVTLGLPIAGPKPAVPNWYVPASELGGLTSTAGLPKDSTFGTPALVNGASSTTLPQRIADAARSALVICGQNLPSTLSKRNSVVLVGEAGEQRARCQVRLLAEAEPVREFVQEHRDEIVQRPVVVVQPEIESEVGAEVRVDVVLSRARGRRPRACWRARSNRSRSPWARWGN